MCRNLPLNKLLFPLVFLSLLAAILGSPYQPVYAQVDEITWSNPINISNSPDDTSTDPFLLADPAGVMHLFWAEKIGVSPAGQPDTLMYSKLVEDVWSKPVDIFFAPISDGNPIIGFPHAILDQNGIIHLIWQSQPNFPYYAVNYSSAPADRADEVQAWTPRQVLADNLTGSKYSIHIAYAPPNTLHVIYSRGAQGEQAEEERAVDYIRSIDLGKTWAEPISLYTVPVANWGTSDTRLLFEPPSNLYASWTVWNETGNGQRIYFIRSLDNGGTWDSPIRLAENIETEYERDWNSLVLLEKNHLMAIYEGGYRAYRYARYSDDAGATWSEPAIDTFPNLIGDNGFIEFARDSNNTLHLFLANRIREGTSASSELEGEALWHSVWEGEKKWRDPTLVSRSEYSARMTNPKVAIVNGNRITAVWYQSQTYEIYAANGIITNAPEIPSIPWPRSPQPQITATRLETQQPGAETPTDVANPLPTPAVFDLNQTPGAPSNLWNNLMLGMVPVLIVVILLFIYIPIRNRRQD